MRLVYNFVLCLLLAESNGGRIEDIYVVDPKKSLNAGWESIHFIVAANTHWREAIWGQLIILMKRIIIKIASNFTRLNVIITKYP